MENCYEIEVLDLQTLQQLKVENIVFIHVWQAGTISRVFRKALAVQEVRFLIASCKKLYRKQTEFLITEHLFEKSNLSFLQSSFLKAGLYCIGMSALFAKTHFLGNFVQFLP